MSRKLSNKFGFTFFNCGKGISQSAIKYSISTNTRYLIKASSEKNFERELVLLLYLPSIGDTAFNSFKVVIVVVLLESAKIGNSVQYFVFHTPFFRRNRIIFVSKLQLLLWHSLELFPRDFAN